MQDLDTVRRYLLELQRLAVQFGVSLGPMIGHANRQARAIEDLAVRINSAHAKVRCNAVKVADALGPIVDEMTRRQQMVEQFVAALRPSLEEIEEHQKAAYASLNSLAAS